MPRLRLSFGDVANMAAALIASGVVIVSFHVFSPLDQIEKLRPLISQVENAQNVLVEQNERMTNTISQLEIIIDGVERDIARFENILLVAEQSLQDDEIKFVLQDIRANSEQFDQRIQRMEGIFAQSPERAVDAELLRGELKLVSGLLESRISSADQNIERIYSMFGWSFGGIIVFMVVQTLGRIVPLSRANQAQATGERKEK